MLPVEIKTMKDGLFGDAKTGWSAYPFMYGFGGEKGADLRGVHVVAIYPGQARGNHYHKDTNEVLFIFSGEGVFYWEEDGNLREHMVSSGGPTVITVAAGVKHAFRNTGESTVYLIALRDGAYDMRNPDVVSSTLL